MVTSRDCLLAIAIDRHCHTCMYMHMLPRCSIVSESVTLRVPVFVRLSVTVSATPVRQNYFIPVFPIGATFRDSVDH